ncbi:MAG: response regulator [Oryzomonas sp.]|uniref:response regulator n=1 Tax=Oryzomonas sp. TaxID=2855186 RepID=UPI00283F0BF2|nr:response regulator [Oryzomonas sp.]MDR3581592.1 response regulator [Oryzomonas sp.]
MRILHVEDNPSDADLLVREFERTASSIKTEWVRTCKDALDRLDRCSAENPRYDMLLADIKLPDGNGMSLIPYIRDRRLPIAIVIITGAGNEDTAVAALKAGADDYVVKGDANAYLSRLPLTLENARKRFHDEFARYTRPLHVLYAEWNTADIDLTRRHMQSHAPYITLEVVGTAQEVLQRLSLSSDTMLAKDGHPCDVLLFDYNLPGMSGLELIKELHETRRLDLPVVLITGVGGEEVVQQAIRLGAMDYVAKNPGYLYHLPVIIENAYNRVQIVREQKALKAKEEHFRLLVENISDIIVELDAHGIIRYVSPSIERVLGFTPEQLSGRDFQDYIHPDDRVYALQFQAHLLQHIGVTSPVVRLRVLHGDGSWRFIEEIGKGLADASGGKTLVLSIRDITEHRILEEQVLQQQKLESIGLLAGGIAHDFNNLLTPICGYAEMIRLNSTSQEPVFSRASSILEAANKARNLVGQLLSFSRKQALDLKHYDLNELIASFMAILRSTIRENIEIRVISCPEACPVTTDRTQIEQILMNLAVNAQYAIHGNGTITIEANHVEFDHEYSLLHPGAHPGRHVLLSFSDSGSGMDDATLAHIFEPFFTTKPEGLGTGLGLSTVYGIVKQHGGFIDVQSGIGSGTVFRIFLPESPAEKSSAGTTEHVHAADRSNTGRILLVEDNQVVMKLAEEILKAQGHITVATNSPQEALALALDFSRELDLLITDVVMPQMSGPELSERLRQIIPGLKVLFISGYAHELIVHQGHIEEGVHFLSKPFSMETLLKTVENILSD